MTGRAHPGGVPFSVDYPEMPLWNFLQNSARKFPARDAAAYLGNRVSYAELWRRSLGFTSSLARFGVERGDRVALILPNTPQFVIALNGALAAGGAVVPVNPLNPVEEIERELEETEAKTVVVLDRLLDRLPLEVSTRVLVAEGAAYASLPLKLASRASFHPRLPKEAVSFDVLSNEAPPKKLADVDPKKDISAILYTSGTTGKPKGVMLTHYSLVANALQSYFWLRGWGYSAKPQPEGWPVILCAVPFFHSYGLNVLNEAVSFGCTLALVPDPNPGAILEAVSRNHVTHMPLIPRFAQEVLDHPSLAKYDLSSVTTASSGGASIRPELMRRFEEVASCRFYQGYGLTEAGPATHATPIEGEANYMSAGLPYPDTEVRVVDLQLGAIDLPLGQAGELLIRGPQIMAGYWKAPEETEKALSGGWLHTGDIVRVDEAGWLYVIGRKRDRIVSAGHSVWPTEVEEVIAGHPSVESVIAVGAPDPLRCSTDIQVFVVLKPDIPREGIEGQLMDLCRSKLESYKVPGRIELVPSLPTTPMGKVDRLAVETEIERRVQTAMDKSAKLAQRE